MSYYGEPDPANVRRGICLAILMAFLLIIYVVAPS